MSKFHFEGGLKFTTLLLDLYSIATHAYLCFILEDYYIFWSFFDRRKFSIYWSLCERHCNPLDYLEVVFYWIHEAWGRFNRRYIYIYIYMRSRILMSSELFTLHIESVEKYKPKLSIINRNLDTGFSLTNCPLPLCVKKAADLQCLCIIWSHCLSLKL